MNSKQMCPCGSKSKFKKCCESYLQGKKVDDVEALMRARYSALVLKNIKFLWQTLHPHSSRKLNDTWAKYEADQVLMKAWQYQELIVLDGDVDGSEKAVVVYFIRASEGDSDRSYLEEAYYRTEKKIWYYDDGLRRSAKNISIDPLTIKIGQLAEF